MKRQRIVLGGGCFWCVEGVFNNVKGVLSAISAYTGGEEANPSYQSICTGATGHAEVVDISYDGDIISLSEILDIFFAIHDPTTLNRQGGDQGTQYRSVIYYESASEGDTLLKYIQSIEADFNDPIVTEISVLENVYNAEDYHQDYYKLNSNQGYCQAVIAPKLQKFMTNFPQNIA